MCGRYAGITDCFFAAPRVLKVGREAWQLFHCFRLENLGLEESVLNYVTLLVGVYKTEGVTDIS